jgi:hypothetical protein
MYSTRERRWISRREALAGPPIALLEALKQSPDAPCTTTIYGAFGDTKSTTTVRWDMGELLRFYKTWAPTAWTELLNDLPERKEKI